MGAGKGFAWKRSTGVLHTDQRLVITRMAMTAVGKLEIETDELDLGQFSKAPDPLVAGLRHLTQEERLTGEVVAGIDPRGMYAVTRQLTEDDKEQTAAELVSSQLGTMEGGLAAAMTPAKLHGGNFRLLVAASKSRARALLAGLNGLKAHHIQLPAVSQVILRHGLEAAKRPRRWQSMIRVLPGKAYGVAILSVGDLAVAWRMFAPGRTGRLSKATLEPALLGMLDHARKDLLIDGVDGCLIQVGSERQEYQMLAEDLAADLDVPVTLAGEARVDPEDVSRALAEWGLRAPPDEINLFEGLQPRQGLMENFPRKAAAGLLITILGCGYGLWSEATDLEVKAAKLQRQAKQDASRAHVKLSDLKKAHEVLRNEFKLAQVFTGKRVFFEDFLRELPGLLPFPMRITRIDGFDAVRLSDKTSATAKKTKLQLTTEMDTPMGGSTPPEVAKFTEALRESPAFKASFPRIAGSSMRLQDIKGGLSRAKLVVTCMPKKG